MQTLPEIFKNCSTIQIEQECPICKTKLKQKRVKIDEAEFKGLKKIGITHKAVNFCSNPKCSFLEQGIVYIKEYSEQFLNLEEINALIYETIGLAVKLRKSNDI